MTGLSEFALKLAGTGASIVVIAILWNLIRQIFLRNPNEPPLVFHWLPIIGSTITYGIDPLKFFAQCQAKVCVASPTPPLFPIFATRADSSL